MRTRRPGLAILLLSGVVACGPVEETAAVETKGLGATELGALGARVFEAPDSAAEILAREGLTPRTFERRVREVTRDPELSVQYRRAYEAHLRTVDGDGTPPKDDRGL